MSHLVTAFSTRIFVLLQNTAAGSDACNHPDVIHHMQCRCHQMASIKFSVVTSRGDPTPSPCLRTSTPPTPSLPIQEAEMGERNHCKEGPTMNRSRAPALMMRSPQQVTSRTASGCPMKAWGAASLVPSCI